MALVVQYIENHFHQCGLADLHNTDVMSLLNGRRGPLVDATLYMIPSSGSVIAL